MDKTTGFGGKLFETLINAGSKSAETSSNLAGIGLSAMKKTVHSQLELTAAFAALVTSQLGSLTSVTKPGEFLQRQKEIGEVFGSKLNGYVEGLREIGVETQAAYAAVAQGVAADLGLKTA